MKAHSLQDLGALREALARVRCEAAERARREAEQRAAAERARRFFADAVGPVTPLAPSQRADVGTPRPEPWPHQREADERAALRQTWSEALDAESLLLTDDGLSFRRPGVGPDVLTRLRRGHWTIQAEIDLHGLRRDEAREALQDFLAQALLSGRRCVRIVHGKGQGSPGRHPVLKGKVQRWLSQSTAVIAFAQASGPLGGAGALIALLDRDSASGE